MIKSFSKKEALTLGWETTKNNILFLVGFLIIFFVLIIVTDTISEVAEKTNSFSSFIIDLINIALSFVLSMSLLRISLQYIDKKKGSWNNVREIAPLFLNYVASSILYGLIVIAGLLLLIIPGIIWSIKFGLYRFLIIDKNYGPVEALKRSAEITNGAKWNLFVFVLLASLINMLGFLALGVGLLVTIPTTAIAMTFIYRELLNQTETNLQRNE